MVALSLLLGSAMGVAPPSGLHQPEGQCAMRVTVTAFVLCDSDSYRCRCSSPLGGGRRQYGAASGGTEEERASHQLSVSSRQDHNDGV